MNTISLSTTILMLDGERHLRMQVSEHLRSLSYIVQSIPSAEELVSRLSESTGFVLIDASTAALEADRLLTELERNYPELPVIIASEAAEIPDRVGGRLAAEYPLLVYPCTERQVEHAVRHASYTRGVLYSAAQKRETIESEIAALKSHVDGVERQNVKLQREHVELSKVAQRHRSEMREFAQSERMLSRIRSAVDSARDGMLILDIEGRVEYSNPAYDELFGTPMDQPGPYSLAKIFSDRNMAGKVIDNVSVLGTFTCEVPLRQHNGGTFPGMVHANRIDCDELDAGGILFIFTDITEQERLRQEAQFDALTGSYGRRYFLEILAGNTSLAERHGHPLTLVMCDLDKFKEVNDTHGHRMGDKVLMTFAEVARSELRQEDIVGRLGGDEFVLLLPHVGAKDICSGLQRIRHRFEEMKFRTDTGEVFHVTVTMGAAEFPGCKISDEEYIELADQSLYKAKELGRNCLVANGNMVCQETA